MGTYFFHSMFRTGSTHFQRLIESSSPKETRFWKEALHEVVYFSKDDISIIENYRNESLNPDELSHGLGRQDYFLGLENSYKVWGNLIDKEMIYDGFFSKERKSSGSAYFAALADWHGGQTVFVECRTGCRIGALKKHLGGNHAYLLREPIAQWLSYKTTDPYFEATNLLILNAADTPAAMKELKQTLGIVNSEYDDLAFAFEDYLKRELSIGQSYAIFFLIWSLCLDHASQFANIIISVDEITKNGNVSPEIEAFLSKIGISGVDWGHFKVPGVKFSKVSSNYFFDIESEICKLLKTHGWKDTQLANLQRTISRARDSSWSSDVTNVAETEYEIREYSRIICEEIQMQHLTETRLKKALRDEILTFGRDYKTEVLKQYGELSKKYDALAMTLSKMALAEDKAKSRFLEEKRKLKNEYLSEIQILNEELQKMELSHSKQIEVLKSDHEVEIEGIRNDLGNEISELKAGTENVKAGLTEVERAYQVIYNAGQQLNLEIDNLKASRSWRITKPLRSCAELARRAKQKLNQQKQKPVRGSGNEPMTVQKIIRDHDDV